MYTQVPGPFDLEAVMKSKASDPSALHVVLLQEVERYNSLLVRLRSSCSQVQAGLKGLVVMSADLDEIADALFNAKVRASCPIIYTCHLCARAVLIFSALFERYKQTYMLKVPLNPCAMCTINWDLCNAVLDIPMSKALINLTLMSSYAMAGVLCCTLLIEIFKTLPSGHGCGYISTGASPECATQK